MYTFIHREKFYDAVMLKEFKLKPNTEQQFHLLSGTEERCKTKN